MRLIDADALIKDFGYLYTKNRIPVDMRARTTLSTVMEQPTAYDIDEVVDELKKASCMARPVGWSNSKKIVETNTAIEIIKSGGLVSDQDNMDARR